MTTVNLELRKSIVERMGANQKYFTVDFIKKDGTPRTMTCQFGVKKHLVGNGPATTAHIPKYVVAYEVNKKTGKVDPLDKKNYRNINLETMTRITGGKETIRFDE